MRDGVSASVVACPAGAWPSALDFLAQRLPQVSRADWHARLLRGDVLDEQGRALHPGAPFRANSRLYYFRQLDAEPVIPFEAQIVFLDDTLLVADKPHFLPVTPAGRYVQQTLLTRLKRATGIETLTPIHRIDRETAGLVLFSIRPADRNAYQTLFRERAVDKVYEAIAPFRPDLALPLTHRSRLQERTDAFMQMEELAGGEPNAETHIALIERLGDSARYELRPHTGQKHQLRVHMSGLGLPIVGDRIYPVLRPEESVPDFSHPLQLLAREIAFTDPLNGNARRFFSGLRLATL
jgi:tRNA pseudouridine32 synthase/23S rRNA pseudouridine746 synthase